MTTPRPRVLVIDDDQSVASALHRGLVFQYQPDLAFCGQTGLNKVAHTNYAAILLDMHLPDIPGLVFCQKLRDNNNRTPLIIITADTDIKRKIAALEAGADDYVIKPFSVDEILARLNAIIRRNPSLSLKIIKYGDLILDPSRREVKHGDKPIDLRRKEFDMLECLMHSAGRVVSRQSLIDYVWNGDDSVWANSVDVQIKYLRDKIDRPFETHLIKTVRGLGYKLSSN